MATIPIKTARRWEDYKFLYTHDDGSTIITSDRIALTITGSYILPPTPMFEARKVTNPELKKAKFWGKPENLRRLEIDYTDTNNVNGRAETRRYNPYPPTTECKAYIQEVRAACKVYLSNPCVSYRGENRFTPRKPQEI